MTQKGFKRLSRDIDLEQPHALTEIVIESDDKMTVKFEAEIKPQ